MARDGDALVAGLEPYLIHTADCSYRRFMNHDMVCRCGLDETILALVDALADKEKPDE